MKSIPADCWDELQQYQCLVDVCAAFHHDSAEIRLQVGSR